MALNELTFYDHFEVKELPTERHREVARRWLGYLGRHTGRYDIDKRHLCNEMCFYDEDRVDERKAFGIARLYTRQKRKRDDESEDSVDVSKRGDSIKFNCIHAINSRLNLYGCPHSGALHCCGETLRERRQTCQLRRETLEGGYVCRYSGLVIYESAPVYNKFTETNMELEFSGAPVIQKPKRIGAPSKKKRPDTSTHDAVPKLILERHVVAMPEGCDVEAYDKPSTYYQRKLQIKGGPTPPNAKYEAPLSGNGYPSKNTVTIFNRYSIQRSAFLEVKKIVNATLFDVNVRRDMGDTVPPNVPEFCDLEIKDEKGETDDVSSDAEDKSEVGVTKGPSRPSISMIVCDDSKERKAKFLLSYTECVCLIYVVVKRVWMECPDLHDSSSMSSSQNSRRRRNAQRKRRQQKNTTDPLNNAGSFPSAKQTCFVILRLLSQGVVRYGEQKTTNQSHVIPKDPLLEQCLPNTNMLRWYGISSEQRMRLKNYGANSGGPRNASQNIFYTSRHEEFFTNILKEIPHPDIYRVTEILRKNYPPNY